MAMRIASPAGVWGIFFCLLMAQASFAQPPKSTDYNLPANDEAAVTRQALGLLQDDPLSRLATAAEIELRLGAASAPASVFTEAREHPVQRFDGLAIRWLDRI